MGLAWNPWALADLVAAPLSFALAAFVYFAAPRRTQNRRLALFLFVMGGLRAGYALQAMATDAATFIASARLFLLLWVLTPAAYLWFLATVPSPLSSPLRTKAGSVFIATLLGVAAVLFVAFRPLYAPGAAELFPGFHRKFTFDGSVVDGTMGLVTLALVLYSLSVTWTAYVAAPRNTPQRARAAAYAAAFGAFDAFWILYFCLRVPYSLGVWVLPDWIDSALFVGMGLASIVLVVLLSYGILKTELFDIDLKLKWTLRRGTVATAFLLVFFVVSQLIERLASEKLGYISGAAAAGVLLLAINPLQRTADRFADKAMPRVQDTAEYATFRKLEVYKAAVEELAVGGITAKERRALDALRGKLGIAASDAKAMERDAVAARGVA